MESGKTRYAIGIDLGGTAVKYALIDETGKFHLDGLLPSMADISAEAVIGQISKAVAEVRDMLRTMGLVFAEPG